MTVNGMHGWPNGWHRGELHELDCIGPLCRCERVLRVVETASIGLVGPTAGRHRRYARLYELQGSGE